MKILQINKLYPPHLGGMENAVRNIAVGLATDHSYHSAVLACQGKGKREIVERDGVKVYRAASWGILFSLPISLDFFHLFRKITGDYDLLLIHHPFPLASLARFFFLDKTKPVVVWYHSDIVRQRLFYWLLYPFLYLDLRAAKTIIVASRRQAAESPLLKKFLNKCRIIPFGIDQPVLSAGQHSAADALRAHYGRFMLAVGRLIYYKGYLDLLEAMKTAPGKVLIIGAGPLEQKMKKIISDNRLAEKVIIISDRPADLSPYYQACEFLVFPSNQRSETFGLVQIEAMACGKPVINTDLPTGVPEVSLNKKTGLTVPVHDPKSLSEAIESLWNDEKLRSALGEGARQRAKDNFSKDKFETDLKSVLAEIINGPL